MVAPATTGKYFSASQITTIEVEEAITKISLVIPAYNEALLLPRLLASVDVARKRYRAGPDAVQVIVADNESTDNTAILARDHGCQVVSTSIRRIGAVRNAGAAAARGSILCFIDADAQIHAETFNAVEASLESEHVIGGATGVQMERWSVGIAMTYALLVPIVWVTGFDTGVVFCRRTDFEEIGGYDAEMPYAEDVMFLFALRRLARKRRQHLVRLTRAKAITSARKFDEHGEWHYFPMIARAVLQLLRVGDRGAFAERYWYRPRR